MAVWSFGLFTISLAIQSKSGFKDGEGEQIILPMNAS